MGLNNPSSGVNPWPNGNTSVAVGDKSWAAGEHNIAGGTQIIPSAFPGDGLVPLDPPDSTPQTFVLSGDLSFLAVGDRLICRSQSNAVNSAPITDISYSSGDDETSITINPTDYLYNGIVSAIAAITFSAGEACSVASGRNNATAKQFCHVGGGIGNLAAGDYSCILGGHHNTSSGDYSNIGGGEGNVITDQSSVISGGSGNQVRSRISAVGGGQANIASGEASVIPGGQNNSSEGNWSNVAGGYFNNAVGSYSNIGGGRENQTNSDYTAIPGGYRAFARMPFSSARAAGQFASPGDAQDVEGPILRVVTTNATPTELLADGSIRLALASNSAWTFSLLIIAYRTDSSAFASYRIDGCIHRGPLPANTTLDASTKTVLFESDAAYDVTVSADTTNGSLKVEATGKSGQTIRWVCTSRIAEVLA